MTGTCGGAGQGASCPVTGCLKAIAGPVDFVTKWLLIANMGIMTILVVAQVIIRYFFSHSIDWADEVSRLTFVWAMFLSIPHGFKVGSHVGIDTIVNFLRPAIREKITRLMLVCCAALSLVVFYYGLDVTREKWQELMPTVNLTAAVYYFPVLISMAHSFLHLVILVVGGTGTWREGKSA